MKLNRDYYPVFSEVLRYATERIKQYKPGDYCRIRNSEFDEDRWIWSNYRYYKVIEIHQGSIEKSLFSCSFTPPIFIVENLITGKREDAIHIVGGRLEGGAASFQIYFKEPTQIIPFAACQGKPKGIEKSAQHCNHVQIEKIDRVTVTEFLQKQMELQKYFRDQEEEKRKAQIEKEKELLRREQINSSISDDQISSMLDAVRNGAKN